MLLLLLTKTYEAIYHVNKSYDTDDSIFYQVLPDSIFNLNQDSDGDATVFDMNADLLTTVIKIGVDGNTKFVEHGVFYSIVPYETPSDNQ